ncbi:MAG: SMI1/KNR4 family protein [Micromonosporaceae bacterium]
MSSNITGSGPVLANEDLDAFERRTGRVIPAPYRAFLLQHNGGYPDPSDFLIKGDGQTPELMGTVEQFLGVGTDDEYAEMERYLTLYRDRIPGDYFPIAQDPGGNVICMATEGTDAGKIYFWDHEEEAEEGQPASRQNLYLVASGLEEFLQHLR